MDFKRILKQLLASFGEQHIRYALIGGFALGARGIPRSTVDIDFLIHHDDLQKVQAVMTSMGYECRYQTENVSQYVSPLKIFGEVDFLHAFRKISMLMLQRADEIKIFEGSLTARVLKVEDLIGLKVQAMANDSTRTSVDLPDIEMLMDRYREELDWNTVQEYFALFEQQELFSTLKRKYHHAE